MLPSQATSDIYSICFLWGMEGKTSLGLAFPHDGSEATTIKTSRRLASPKWRAWRHYYKAFL